MRILLRLCLAFGFLGLSACMTITRDSRSGYSHSEPNESVREFYQDREDKEEMDAREELGYSSRPLNEQEKAKLDERLRLHRMEMQLESKRDRKQYYSVRSALHTDRERMAFLSLPSYEIKQRWLQNKGYLKEEGAYPESVAKTIEAQDIALGMSQKAVRESWGDPDFVENAGDPMYGYERWNYHRFTPSSDGFQKENRVVYFESGHVVGWETASN
jgi:hypothetical protein